MPRAMGSARKGERSNSRRPAPAGRAGGKAMAASDLLKGFALPKGTRFT